MNMKGLLNYGKNGCDIPYDEIGDISELIKSKYIFSSVDIWMWEMFQFGFAYGKRKERDRRKKVQL